MSPKSHSQKPNKSCERFGVARAWRWGQKRLSLGKVRRGRVVGHNQILQSMRGIAAMVVVYGHATYLVPMEANAAFRMEILLFQAKTAVVFFFVLSGFVLGQSVRRLQCDGSPLWFARYVVIRLARLVPIFWLSTLVGAAVAIISSRYRLADMGAWYYAVATTSAPTWAQVIEAIAKLEASFNGDLWSIRVEYWMMAILPPMVILSRKIPVWADAIVILAGCALARIVVYQSLYEPTESAAVTCWAYCFYVGVALPKIIASLGKYRWVFCSGASAMISLTLMVYLMMKSHGMEAWGNTLILDGLLSASLIAWAQATTGSIGAKVLSWRPLVVLGDMSYSVYAYGQALLIPTTIVVVSMLPHSMRTEPRGGALLTLLCPTVSLVILLPMSWLSYVYVKQKATRLGRRTSLAISSLLPGGIPTPSAMRSVPPS